MMSHATTVRLVLLLVGAIPVAFAVYGLWTGKAYLPTKRASGAAPFVYRANEPVTYWGLVLFQFTQGVFLAVLPYWRL